MKKTWMLAALAFSIFFAACNGGNNSSQSNQSNGGAPVSNTVSLQANDSLKYDKIEINVKAGEKVTLTLTNVGKMPKESMGHNFVLLKDGTDLDKIEKESVNAPDHIPADSAVIAHTKLLGPGESDTIEFTVPAGQYTYICTFPGHYKTMIGELTAQ